jgi:hypothetical protein
MNIIKQILAKDKNKKNKDNVKDWKAGKSYKKDDTVKYNDTVYTCSGVDELLSVTPDKADFLWKSGSAPTPDPGPTPDPTPDPGPYPDPTPIPIGNGLVLNVNELKDLKAKNTTWNIFKIGHGADNSLHEITKDPLNKIDTVLKVKYPKNSFKPSGKIPGGIGFYASPVTVFPGRKVRFSYELYFDDNFDPVKGGKLPGLFIGSPGASGGKHENSKSSCRLMWRKDMQGEAYVYMPCKQVDEYQKIPSSVYNPAFGDSLWRGLFKFEHKKWNTVNMLLTLNDDAKTANGKLELTINGVTQHFDKFLWSVTDSVLAGITTDTFFGGGDDSFATPHDTSICFKNFQVEKLA